MRRLFKVLGSAVLALILLVAGVAITLLRRPDLAINDRSAAWALERFATAFKPRWSRLEARAWSEGMGRQLLSLDTKDLCLSGPQPPWRVCFRRLFVRAEIELGPTGLRLVRVGRLLADVKELEADLSAPRPKAPEGDAARRPGGVPSWLSLIRLGAVRIDSPNNLLRLATGTVSASALAALPEDSPRALELEVLGTWIKPGSAERLSAKGRVLSDLWDGALTFLDADLDLASGRGAKAGVKATIRPEADGRLKLEAKAQARLAPYSLSVDAAGAGDRSGLRGLWSARFRDEKGLLRSAALERCRLEAALGEERPFPPGRGSLSCRYWLEPKPAGARSPRRLKGLFMAAGTVKNGKRLDGRARLTIEPTGDWYRFSGNLSLAAAGRLGKGVAGLRLTHDANAELKVPRFEDLVEYFRSTSFAIPAPLNVLHGPVELRVAGAGDSRSDPQRFDVEGSADLKNQVQRARLKLTGKILARRLWLAERKLEAELDLALDDVALQLPYLELQAPPKLAVDPRIKAEARLPEGGGEKLRLAPAARPAASPFSMALRIRTPAAPVRLSTNLIEDPVPLRFDMKLLQPGGVSGLIAAEPFNVELFRRRAQVERFRVTQSTGSSAGGLDASIRYKTPEAVIRILLVGSTEKPRVQLMSEPPMDRTQILSLLLFGKPPSALGSEEQSSIGATNAALTEQAFGLASLFVFASTPIEFVGYNPETQSYVVRFRLPGGATAELGSDLEERRRLRVRKRLTRSWALETELRRESQTERNAVTTFLEWFRRY